MTISNCNGMCWKDDDTGETFCPVCGWVWECPKKSCSQSRADAPNASSDEDEAEEECDSDDEEVSDEFEKTVNRFIDPKWDEIPRYVIRGKPDDPEYHDQAYGACGCDIMSYMVFLYTEKWQVQERFDELCKAWMRNSHVDFAEHFEIHQVTKEELYSTFKKAQII